MLDKNVLSQLSELKQQIQAQKEYAKGVVIATNGRFGFVRLEDGRDAFLNAEQMQRVLPNDRVKICITQNHKGQWEAELESLVHCPLEDFIGQYQVNGKSHFVAPDVAHFKRWLFVPPNNRNIAKALDFVHCRLTRHPFKDGRAQVKVLEKICGANDDHAERRYTMAKFGLERVWEADHKQQIAQLIDKQDKRIDLSDNTFVTIDSESTLDMDDALSISWDEGQQQWCLMVAIADPASFIAVDSPLAKAAQQFGQTAYLPGQALHMLPENLAEAFFSLVEQEARPALIGRLIINREGHINHYEFFHGTIKSAHKLSYKQVSHYLEQEDTSIDEPAGKLLKQLQSFAEARCSYRKKHYLVVDHQGDYDLTLDSSGKIKSITPVQKTIAHKLVEECMLACNLCAGEFLSQHQQGIFSIHKGFKSERLGEIRALLKEELPEQNRENLNDYNHHIELIQTLHNNDDLERILSPLKRMMQPSQISLTAEPHLGLGVPVYATITSPIRRYTDLYNHWAIQSILSEQTLPKLTEESLASLQSALDNTKQAARDLERWLYCYFLEDYIDQEFEGHIRIVTQQGFGVRLSNWGIDGFVLLGTADTKPKFDAKRMTLSLQGITYYLEQVVQVKIEKVDIEKRRINFSLAGAK